MTQGTRSIHAPSLIAVALWALVLMGPFTALGQTSSTELNFKPVMVHFTTLSGLQYSVGDEYLVTEQQFRDLIHPLRDFETERMLNRSEASDLNSKIFGGVGVAGLLTGIVGLLSTSSSQQTPFWIAGIGGVVSIDIAGLFGSEAQTAKFNCIQRYNRFARGEEQVLPRGPVDEKSLLDFGSTVQPKPTSEPLKK